MTSWKVQTTPSNLHTQQLLPSSSQPMDPNPIVPDKELKKLKKQQPRQLLSCTKCRERKVKCDRTKPCSACCARGLPKECHFVLGEGADFGPIQQSLEIRKLRAENQRLKERLLAGRASLSEESETEEGPSTVKLRSAGSRPSRQRRFLTNDQTDSLYFGSPGLASVISDFANLQLQPKSLAHAMPRAADMYATQDSMYPFPTLWPATSRTEGLLQCLPPREELHRYLDSFNRKALGFAFPWIPEAISQKEVEHFLESAEENAEKVPDLLALIFAALALGVQLEVFDEQRSLHADASQVYNKKSEIFSVASMQALRLASFTNRPSLKCIQTLMVLAPYLTNSGRFLDAWTLSGTTIRLAHSMGLHRNPRFLDPAPSLRESMARKHLWWWLLHLDQQYAMTLGRPLGISGTGDCPPPDPLTTDPVALRLCEFFDQLTILGRQILSSSQLTNSRIDMFTDRLIALWDTMPDSLQFNRSWVEEQKALPDWPMAIQAAMSYCSIHNYIILLNRQRIENNRKSPEYQSQSPPPRRFSIAPEHFLQPATHHFSPTQSVPRGRPLVLDSCLALLDAFLFFYKRAKSSLVDWTIGQQAFNACMVLLLDAFDKESLHNIERVETTYHIFVEMDKIKLHQLTALAVSRISEGLALLRKTVDPHKAPVHMDAISPLSIPTMQEGRGGQEGNPFDWSMGQSLRANTVFHEPVMGATGMFLLEDHGLQSGTIQPAAPSGFAIPSTIQTMPSQKKSHAQRLAPDMQQLDPRRDSAHPAHHMPVNHTMPGFAPGLTSRHPNDPHSDWENWRAILHQQHLYAQHTNQSHTRPQGNQ